MALSKTTLPKIWWPLMEGCTIKLERCAICGRSEPLNQHHVVRRGAGKLFVEGHEIKKSTITLCGFGNNLQDSYGRNYCHGLAHANRLHFRWVKAVVAKGGQWESHLGGHWEYLLVDEPIKYQKALEMDGWKPLPYA